MNASIDIYVYSVVIFFTPSTEMCAIIYCMEIKREDIIHLAELSDLALDKKETESLKGDLQSIIKYISQLDELDTEGTEPTYQVFEMENVWREDKILPQDATREQLLELTKEAKDNQIKVAKVL